MENTINLSCEQWYWFIPSIMKCDQASAIRCFLAPIYLPYINDTPEKEILKAQREWVDFYEEKVTTHSFDDSITDPVQDNVKKRLKILGTFLCESVLIKSGIECNKYLGKNRNVGNFPERFICSIFPTRSSKGVFDELWSYYFNLLSQVFGEDESYVSDVLLQLEEINKNTEYFHVPDIVSQSNDIVLKKIDRIAYLLCSFCVLSSAFTIKENPKNGIRPHLRDNVFKKAQVYLEIPVSNEKIFQTGEITMSYTDLLGLNVTALALGNIELLRLVHEINRKNMETISHPGKDCISIKSLINSIKSTQLEIINRMNSQLYDIGKGAEELLLLTDIEKFWQEIYRAQ